MPYEIEARKIQIDRDTQARVAIDEGVVKDYADAMQRGEEFPAILVYFDEATDEYILADGFHRYLAHMQVRPNDMILAEQRLGTAGDAQWAAITANQNHGCRRTNADKRNAVRLAILHPQARHMKDREIARHVGVSHRFASLVRSEMERNDEIPWHESPMQKAAKALADPANAGKSNREIATLCHVSEKTVRDVRNSHVASEPHDTEADEGRPQGGAGNVPPAYFGNGCQNTQVEDSQPKDGEHRAQQDGQDGYSPQTPQKTCAACDCYSQGQCEIDCAPYPPEHPPCEEFIERAPPESEDDVPDVDPKDVKLIDDPIKRPRRRNPHQYRRLKDCRQLYLPPDNPQLFAIELRNNFQREYLTACLSVLKQLWADDDEDPAYCCGG